ncbi:MAG: HEAT repeat domain-containing protein [Anaerolineales bacterium]|nr:HEAT repeat domain-containing protein [Anaerolineales bacterium]
MNEKDWLVVQEKARGVYRWLWWSPLLTAPTGVWLSGLMSALWHLVLLNWAKDSHPFVKWHGRQGFLLAGIRTLLAFGFLTFLLDGSEGFFFFFLLLVCVWFFGNRWGMKQVNEGDCWLMRWWGLSAELETFRELNALAKRNPPENSTNPWLNQLLHTKSTFERQQAASQLGELESSSEEVIEALQWASHRDVNEYVRDAAFNALQAPVHQAFLQARKRDAEQAVLPNPALDPQKNYEAGLRLLEAGQRQEGVTRLVAAFRDGAQEVRQMALQTLEEMGEVEVF